MAESTRAFPKHFLWGAATAAHQVEGKMHNQWSVWELENARSLAAQAEYHVSDYPSWERIKKLAKTPANYVSGRATQHYDRYEEDFDLLESMNMNAYRFSIEWSRVEPEEGVWNAEAVEHYRDYLESLKSRGIEPVVTLFHFTLPVWFAQKGGFAKRRNVDYFVRFAERIMSEIGRSVRYVITINEPEVYTFMSYSTQTWPPAESSWLRSFTVLNNLVYAHKKAAKALRRVNARYKISVAKNCVYFYPGDTSWISRLSANVAQYVQDDYWVKKFARHSDFLGLNYYQSQRLLGTRIHNSEAADYSDVNWMVAPGDLQYVLEHWSRRYRKPIMITENGIADEQDTLRQNWIQQTILAMQQAMKEGVELIGYLHWSLTDNFEWGYGHWPRFGLAAIDYKTGERTLRPSAQWFGRVIKKLRGI